MLNKTALLFAATSLLAVACTGSPDGDGAGENIDTPNPSGALGRSATIIMTLSDPGIEALAPQLIGNTIDWVTDKADPKIMLIHDDGHHGEAQPLESQFIPEAMAGRRVTQWAEGQPGITYQEMKDYDIVWLSNPGYSIDNKDTFDALVEYYEKGGAVVLQGDDVTWNYAPAFSTSILTHVDNPTANNGVEYCGTGIDNNGGGQYLVTFLDHPMANGIVGQTIEYGNDIDISTPRHEGETIVATAVVKGKEAECASIPVVIGFDRNEVGQGPASID